MIEKSFELKETLELIFAPISVHILVQVEVQLQYSFVDELKVLE